MAKRTLFSKCDLIYCVGGDDTFVRRWLVRYHSEGMASRVVLPNIACVQGSRL